jgi:hypothetical protein
MGLDERSWSFDGPKTSLKKDWRPIPAFTKRSIVEFGKSFLYEF